MRCFLLAVHVVNNNKTGTQVFPDWQTQFGEFFFYLLFVNTIKPDTIKGLSIQLI